MSSFDLILFGFLCLLMVHLGSIRNRVDEIHRHLMPPAQGPASKTNGAKSDPTREEHWLEP